MELENYIQKYIEFDNIIKKTNEQKRQLKNIIEPLIKDNNLMKQNIKISDGYLRCIESNPSKSLTWKSLEISLLKIIDEEKVKQIIQFIREEHKPTSENFKFEITRKYV